MFLVIMDIITQICNRIIGEIIGYNGSSFKETINFVLLKCLMKHFMKETDMITQVFNGIFCAIINIGYNYYSY